MRKLKLFALIIFIISFSSCAPFKALPEEVDAPSEMLGLYQNAADTSNSKSKSDLWSHFDRKDQASNEHLQVRIDFNDKDQLQAYLMDQDSILKVKTIKGKFKEDQCYYLRRKFYVIPFFPILFTYANDRKRIFMLNDQLIVENTLAEGGMALFVANAHQLNREWHYQSKSSQ